MSEEAVSETIRFEYLAPMGEQMPRVTICYLTRTYHYANGPLVLMGIGLAIRMTCDQHNKKRAQMISLGRARLAFDAPQWVKREERLRVNRCRALRRLEEVGIDVCAVWPDQEGVWKSFLRVGPYTVPKKLACAGESERRGQIGLADDEARGMVWRREGMPESVLSAHSAALDAEGSLYCRVCRALLPTGEWCIPF